jgi:iron-sulfur cluster repair protein YtfE (RIC family)
MSNLTFERAKEKYLKKLEQYVPIVARVHGNSHPEFHDVHKIFNLVMDKIKESGNPVLDEEFEKLREITDNYKMPDDVCESYEAVYNMLSKLDEAYRINEH